MADAMDRMKMFRTRRIAVACMFATALACSAAHATKPRPIDCAKAQAIAPGWTEKQVVKAMGKPYSVQLGGGSMGYGWQSEDGSDRLSVLFGSRAAKDEERQVVSVAGTCGGSAIAQLRDGEQATMGLQALATLPQGKDLPQRIAFDGTTFHLAFARDSRTPQMRFVEYVPQGQNLSHWKQMVAVFQHTDGSTPADKLRDAEKIAQQTRNPHFKRVDLAKDGSEAIAAFPMLRNDSVEYQVVRWTAVPGGVQASVHFVRNYTGEAPLDAFIADQEQRITARADGLKALAGIVPPPLGEVQTLIFTRNGREDSQVWTTAASTSDAAGAP